MDPKLCGNRRCDYCKLVSGWRPLQCAEERRGAKEEVGEKSRDDYASVCINACFSTSFLQDLNLFLDWRG